MKKRILILLLLVSALYGMGQQQHAIIRGHFRDISFPAFCDTVYQQTGSRIYYKPEWVGPIKVSLNTDSIPLEIFMEQLLAGSGMQISQWNQGLVLLPGQKLLPALPDYRINQSQKDSSRAGTVTVTESEERYLTGRKADVMKSLRIGKNGGPLSNNRAKLLGRILDEETGEPIPGATVYISETRSGAVSDLNGFMSFSLKPGNYNASFEYLGYEKKKYLLEVLSDGNFTVKTSKTVIYMKEVVVHGDRQVNVRTKDPGLDKISIKSIKELPMMMGERDILKVSGLMPGIVSTGEGSSGLNVRGGGADQNAFYLNKVPIYNTAHLFGFFPAFNSDIIRDFSIYKGYVPAKYGGRLSSVFDITARQGNRKKFTVHGGLSPIAANLVVEGPLKKDTCSILLSARSTYSDWILKRLNDPDIRNSSANFNDFSAAFNYDIQKSQFSVFAYHSNDYFRLADINSYTYSNSGASMTFSHNYSNALRGEYSLVASQYNFSTTDKQQLNSAYEHAYQMGHYEARTDFRHKLDAQHALDYGGGVILYQLDRGSVLPYGEESLRNRVNLGKEQGTEASLYLSDTYTPFTWLTATLGVRYAVYAPLGSKTVYEYFPGTPKDTRYISDTLQFGDFEPIRYYHQPEIRGALNFSTDDNGTVKLAFNQMHQNLFMLNNTVTIAPNTQWKLADYHLKPSSANQVSLGVYRTIPGKGLEASAELYWKQAGNYPEFRDGASFLEDSLVEASVLQGKQQAWGVELFLKGNVQKLSGWISYTYSRSHILVNGPETWNQINKGERYPANFDIPHALNVVLNYHLNRRITFSAVIVYQSGKPITYPVSVYYLNGLPVLDYSSRNDYRIPDYFRTDLSIALEGNLRKRKMLHNSLVMSLYNATGRDNAYSVYFKTVDGKIRSYQYSVIAVPILTVTWIFKLGNYASE